MKNLSFVVVKSKQQWFMEENNSNGKESSSSAVVLVFGASVAGKADTKLRRGCMVAL